MQPSSRGRDRFRGLTIERLLPGLAVAAVLVGGCASIGGPPERLDAAACEPDDALTGAWTDRRMGQLGPAWVRLTLRCDCTYSMRIQLLWFRIREEGGYRVEGGELVFERESGETRWPFVLDGDRLSVEEAPGEAHELHEAKDLRCPASVR
jgi:hypothetical protein